MLRPPPGPQLSVGRLRVDAARAIVKLREYQLVDRTAWVLEAIRAAVASGATSIELRGDSNDVWLQWAGEPWPAVELPKLFDELVSPEPGADRQGIRLLAAAVNSALGMNPAYVDVIAIAETGATRVRYTPEILEAPDGDLGDAPLRRLATEPIERPLDAAPGMIIHLRRRASLEVIGYLLRGGEPPEIALARANCQSIAVPLRIGTFVLDRKNLGNDLVRVQLGDGLDGFLAITDPASRRVASPGVTMEIAECGVLLETSSLDLDLEPRHTIPIRLLIDAPKMPTNASRSEVRRDAHPMTTAVSRGRIVIPDLIEALVRMLSVEPIEPRARSAALGLIASVIAGPDWASTAQSLIGPLKALADLPLVRDATGTPRPIAWSWRDFHHAGRSPLSQSLAPWMNNVLWVPPDDPASWLLGWSDPELMKRHRRWARRELRAERRFYRHAKRGAHVVASSRPRVRARLGAGIAGSCIDNASFDGLTGEICLHEQRGGELVVLLAGRELERITFDTAIGFEAVIDSARVRPADRYRGVVRDAEYASVERALRGGLLRAIEALASVATGAACPPGIELSGEVSGADVHWFREAYRLTRELGAEVRPPLSSVPLWPEVSWQSLSLDELRTKEAIGVAPPGTDGRRLSTRPVILVDDSGRAELTRLLPGIPIVRYQTHHLTYDSDSRELARGLLARHPHALAIEVAEHACAIASAPDGDARLVIRHRGTRVAEQLYQPTLLPCAIVIESDAVLPGDGWSHAAALGSVSELDLSALERALVRAAAHALVGERSPDLFGASPVMLAEALGRALCHAVLATDPRLLLGDELIAKLRTQPLLTLLGVGRLHSMDEVAILFPQSIPYVETLGEATPGFTPVVAPGEVVRAVAALTGRQSRNATSELEDRRIAFVRDLRIGRHRETSQRPLALAEAAIGIDLSSTIARGVVGIGRDVLEIQVLVEGRPFQVITRTGEPPLHAVVEIGLEHTLPSFEAMQPERIEELVAAVRDVTPELLVAIVEQLPTALADAGPERDLATAWVTKQSLSRKMRDKLRESIAFSNVQGGRSPLAAAIEGNVLLTAWWSGTWLPPETGEQPDHCDRAIVHVPEGPCQVRTLIDALHQGAVGELTAQVAALQARRQMARGLLPRPRVAAPPELTRPLDAFGEVARKLGIGEIALVPGPSLALIHVHGKLVTRIPIDVLPSVHVALEAPELVTATQDHGTELLDDPIAQLQMLAREPPRVRMLTTQIQRIAILLAQEIMATLGERSLPIELRHNLRRAILYGRFDGRLVPVPVFETATGAWVTFDRLVEQRRDLHNLWAVTRGARHTRPLDDHRIVLVLEADELALKAVADIGVIDATQELALDALTRANRERPPTTSLELNAEGLLAEATLEGDGITAPQGRVGILSPRRAERRHLWPHQKLHPFDEIADPCDWPTVAIVDDARLRPDRTWQKPIENVAWKQVVAAVRAASDTAIRTLTQPPTKALASIRIVPVIYLGLPSLISQPKVQLRGALWVSGPPSRSSSLRVIDSLSEYAIAQPASGIDGVVYVHGPYGWSSNATLQELCALVHGKLVRELLATQRDDHDLVAAHAARALALGRISIDDAKDLVFTCFARPLSAAELAALFASEGAVPTALPGMTTSEVAFADDRSELARVVRDILGPRLRAERGLRRPAATSATVRQPAPRPRHPLQDFIDILHARVTALAIPVTAWRIVDDRTSPIAKYEDPVIEIAGLNPRVIAIAAACHAHSPWADDAVDALTAHVVTVLNIALTSITDASERGALLSLVSATRPAKSQV